MEYTYHVTIHLNARFQPMHRFDLEDALQGILDRMELGAVDGGGTLQMSTGEIRSCDIEVFLKDNEQETIHKLRDIINRLGVPKGSERTRTFLADYPLCQRCRVERIA